MTDGLSIFPLTMNEVYHDYKDFKSRYAILPVRVRSYKVLFGPNPPKCALEKKKH